MSRKARSSEPTRRLRCAIYTRKSSEEGLEQDFNSLHAQRDACEAYVRSQAGEGWTSVRTAYDDGGFSGGSMERPALRKLLADIDAGLVDVVVVYKVDRLTRSLTDFAKIVERFDAKSVSFVSVTQAFNTTSSMGRLTLNVLLSFAQFEREVTGERIRDKIALSKAKGMWMGGTLPLGYDIENRALIVNAAEADVVRGMFRRYLELGSVHVLRDELERTGVRSKRWTTRAGKSMGGAVIGRGGLYHMLRNRLYLGEIVHKDQVHPGRHPPILERELFDAVQVRLDQNTIERRERPTRAAAALLMGKLFDADGRPMSPSFAYGQKGRLYRYYIAMNRQVGERATKSDVIERVGAEALERAVLQHLRRLAARPELGGSDLKAWLVRLELRREETHLVVSVPTLAGGDHPKLAVAALKARLRPGETAVSEPGRPPALRIVLPIRMQLRGGRTWMTGSAPEAPIDQTNPGLVSALRSSHAELLALNASPLTAPDKLTRATPPDSHHRRQLARLPFLAPDLQRMILEGRQPEGVNLRTLLKTDLPLAWVDQREMFRQPSHGSRAAYQLNPRDL